MLRISSLDRRRMGGFAIWRRLIDLEGKRADIVRITKEQKNWVDTTIGKIEAKMYEVAVRNLHKIPYLSENGVYNDMSESKIYWWTNGFWPGIMWQMYSLTGEGLYRQAAEETEEKLDQNFLMAEKLDHDNGFKWLLSAVADYRTTGSRTARNRGLLAAQLLAGRYNPGGHFLRAWNEWGGESHIGWAIIDCMMNLPLLYWAGEETEDPRYFQIADSHGKMALEFFVREDNSVRHIVELDPDTGEFVREHGGQGYGEGSSWTRGQAWGLYGFLLSYLHTGDKKYLYMSQKIANYFLANIPENRLIPADFRQPPECEWEDDSAAACGACGLLELSKYVGEADCVLYRNTAVRLLQTLDRERCNWSQKTDHLLERCTVAYNGCQHNIPLLYADYFFIEALLKLADQELFVW